MIIVAHFTQAWHCSVVSFCISFLRFASCVSRTCAYCYSMTRYCITCLRNKCYGTQSAIRDSSLAQRDNQWMVGPARVYRMWLSDNGITVGHRPGVAVSQAFSYVIYRKRQFELLKHTRCFTEFFFLSRWSQHVRWIRALSNCVTFELRYCHWTHSVVVYAVLWAPVVYVTGVSRRGRLDRVRRSAEFDRDCLKELGD